MNKTPLDRSFTEAILHWYDANKRDLPWRKDKDPYHVWVSEIMLQQTRVEAVREYYLRFMEALPTVRHLAEADEETILKLWQGLGYYNRVRNMQKAARVVLSEADDCSAEQNPSVYFPRHVEGIKALPGIGDYTAGAIASICFDAPTPAIDGNVLRVLSRILEDDEDIKKASVKRKMADLLKDLYPEGPKCGDFTQGMIELGALVCVPNGKPLCEGCPVSKWCGSFAHGTQMEFPVKPVKKERKAEERTVFLLVTEGGRIAVRKRPAGSLLGNLYEFPAVPQHLTAEAAVSQAQAWGCRPEGPGRVLHHKHIFSHVEWHMKAYYLLCKDEGSGDGRFIWVDKQEMEEKIPLPSAFRYFWENV